MPLRNALLKLSGVAYPRGGVALDIRLSFTNRDLARRSLKRLLLWDFDKLIITHCVCIEHDAKPLWSGPSDGWYVDTLYG